MLVVVLGRGGALTYPDSGTYPSSILSQAFMLVVILGEGVPKICPAIVAEALRFRLNRGRFKAPPLPIMHYDSSVLVCANITSTSRPSFLPGPTHVKQES